MLFTLHLLNTEKVTLECALKPFKKIHDKANTIRRSVHVRLADVSLRPMIAVEVLNTLAYPSQARQN